MKFLPTFLLESEPNIGGTSATVDWSAFRSVPVDERPTIVVEEPVETEVEPSVEAKAETPVEEVKKEEEPVKPSIPAQAAEVEKPVEQKQIPWEEAIKSVDKSEVLKSLGNKREVLKALGISDFVADLSDYYDQKGNVDDYLSAKGVDYSKYSDDQILKEKIYREHSGAPEAVREMLFKKELEKYMATPEVDGAEEVQYKEYLKKTEADKYRETLQAEQAKFTIPVKDPAQPLNEEEVISKYQTAQQEKVQAVMADLIEKDKTDPITKTMVDSKKLIIYGDTKFDVSDVDTVLDYTYGRNGKDFYSLFLDKDGNVDKARWYDAVAFAMSPETYKKAIFDAGKTSAVKKEAEDESAKPDASFTPAPAREKSFWEQAKPVNRTNY